MYPHPTGLNPSPYRKSLEGLCGFDTIRFDTANSAATLDILVLLFHCLLFCCFSRQNRENEMPQILTVYYKRNSTIKTVDFIIYKKNGTETDFFDLIEISKQNVGSTFFFLFCFLKTKSG